jgi:hypothetical protein
VKKLLSKSLVVPGHAGLFPNDLERYRLLRGAVVRKKHLTHAALAEALANLVPVIDYRPRTDRGG